MRDNSIYVISAFLCTSAIPSKWINFGKCDISFLIVCREECFKLTLPAKKIIHVISLKNKSHFHTTLHIFSDWWYIAEYLFEKIWWCLIIYGEANFQIFIFFLPSIHVCILAVFPLSLFLLLCHTYISTSISDGITWALIYTYVYIYIHILISVYVYMYIFY